MSKITITGLLVASSELDCWISHYLKGRPVVIAGNSYRIDEVILRHKEGLADVTLLDSNKESEGEGYIDMNQPFLWKEKATTQTDGVNPLLQVDRSLLNRKGRREVDKVLKHQHVKHIQAGLNFPAAVDAACRGKGIRRRGWLNSYWTIRREKWVFSKDGVEYQNELTLSNADQTATDWEAIDID